MIRKLLILTEKPQGRDGSGRLYTFYNPKRKELDEWGVIFNGEYYHSLSNQHYSPLECAYEGLLDWYKKHRIKVYDN